MPKALLSTHALAPLPALAQDPAAPDTSQPTHVPIGERIRCRDAGEVGPASFVCARYRWAAASPRVLTPAVPEPGNAMPWGLGPGLVAASVVVSRPPGRTAVRCANPVPR